MARKYFLAILQAKDGTRAAFAGISGNAKKASRNVNKFFGKRGQSAEAMKSFTSSVNLAGKALGFTVKSLALMGTVGAAATSALSAKAIKVSSDFEGFALRLDIINRNMAKTNEEMERLVQFAARTPFRLPDIAQAQIKLKAMGGAALATAENLETVGNVAVVSGEAISRLSFWFGRAFSEIQNRQALGEVQRRLIEIGIGSSTVTRELEAMRLAGADTGVMFELFKSQFDKARGAMDRLSQTTAGMISTFFDRIDLIFLAWGQQGLAGLFQDLLVKVNNVLAAITKYSEFNAIGTKLVEIFGALKDFLVESAFAAEALAISLERVTGLGPLQALLNLIKSITVGIRAARVGWANLMLSVTQGVFNISKVIRDFLQDHNGMLGILYGDKTVGQAISGMNRFMDKTILRIRELAGVIVSLQTSPENEGGVLSSLLEDAQARRRIPLIPLTDTIEQVEWNEKLGDLQIQYLGALGIELSMLQAITLERANQFDIMTGAWDGWQDVDEGLATGLKFKADADERALRTRVKLGQTYGQVAATIAREDEKAAKAIAAVQMLMEFALGLHYVRTDPQQAANHFLSAATYASVAGQSSPGGAGGSGEGFDPIGASEEVSNTIIINNSFDQDGFQTSIEDTTRDTVIDDFRSDGEIRRTLQGAF